MVWLSQESDLRSGRLGIEHKKLPKVEFYTNKRANNNFIVYTIPRYNGVFYCRSWYNDPLYVQVVFDRYIYKKIY